jgi:drug/metabolite transporter (DMT)-like permease
MATEDLKRIHNVGGWVPRRRLGVIITFVSALFFSTAGVFSKGIASDAWTIIVWRAVFTAFLGIGYLVVMGSLRRELRQFGWTGLAVAVVYASATMAFIPSFKLTTIANVALIWGTVPLMAAAIAWLWFRERMPPRFFFACLLVVIGVAILVQDSVGGVHLIGDLLALWMTLMMAAMMVIYRQYPDTPVVLPTVCGGLFLVPIGFFVTVPLSTPGIDLALCGAFALMFLVASVTLAIGSKHLASGETALISLSETPCAILLAAFILAAIPDTATLIGGALIMAAVVWYQYMAFKESEI